ncbi:conserved Plasmodium membrane protein, unknown function [Plasmodium malariae]|uniref:Potassium channel n=1 Tax=Plasmodium malariae TaxID=5858 RepID=A0A1D3TCJ3_PLAMA|nr:conserved Plasmodium membrane protein, unknown function [Plasmodium malariae]SCP02595.1 conserved Plasmodium membrane protein, unknown function [Plasmodium malariae]
MARVYVVLERIVFLTIFLATAYFFLDFMVMYDNSICYLSIPLLALIYTISYILAILPEIANSVKYTLFYKTRKKKIYTYSLKKDLLSKRKVNNKDLKIDNLIDTSFLYMNQNFLDKGNIDRHNGQNEHQGYKHGEVRGRGRNGNRNGNRDGSRNRSRVVDGKSSRVRIENSDIVNVENNEDDNKNFQGTNGSRNRKDVNGILKKNTRSRKKNGRYSKNEINDYVLKKGGNNKKYIIDSCEEYEKICFNDQRKTLKIKDKIIKYIELNDTENVVQSEEEYKQNVKIMKDEYKVNMNSSIELKDDKRKIGSFLYDKKYLNMKNEDCTEEKVDCKNNKKKYFCYMVNKIFYKKKGLETWKTSYFSGFRSNTNNYTLHSFYDRNKHVQNDYDFSRWHNLFLKFIVNIKVIFVKFCKNTSFLIADLIITFILHMVWVKVHKHLRRNNVDIDTGMFNWNTDYLPKAYKTVEGYLQYFILYDLCIKLFLFFSSNHILSYWFLLNLMNTPFLYVAASFITDVKFKRYGWLYLSGPFRFLNFLRIENLFGQNNYHHKINFPVITLSIQILVVIYTYACIHLLMEHPCKGDYEIYDYVFSGMQTVSTAGMGKGSCFPFTLQTKISYIFYIFMTFTYIQYKIRYLKNHMVEEKKIYGKIPNIGARYFVIIGHIKPIALYVIINELQSSYSNLDEIIILTSLPVKFYINIIRLLNKKGACKTSLCLYDLNKPFPLKIKKIISYSSGIFICNNIINTHHNINNDMETLKRYNEITSLGPFNKYISVLLNNMCNHNILLKRNNRNIVCLNDLKMKLFAKTVDDCPGMFLLILLFFINTPQKLKFKHTYILNKYFDNPEEIIEPDKTPFGSTSGAESAGSKKDGEKKKKKNIYTKSGSFGNRGSRDSTSSRGSQSNYDEGEYKLHLKLLSFVNSRKYFTENGVLSKKSKKFKDSNNSSGRNDFYEIDIAKSGEKDESKEKEEADVVGGEIGVGGEEVNSLGGEVEIDASRGVKVNTKGNTNGKNVGSKGKENTEAVHLNINKNKKSKSLYANLQKDTKKKSMYKGFFSHNFDEDFFYSSYNNYVNYIKGIKYNIYKIKLPPSFFNFHFVTIVQYMYMNYNAYIIGIINDYNEIKLNPLNFVYTSSNTYFIVLTDKYNILQKIQNIKKVNLDWMDNIDSVKTPRNKNQRNAPDEGSEEHNTNNQNTYYSEMRILKNENNIFFNPVLNIYRVENYLQAIQIFNLRRKNAEAPYRNKNSYPNGTSVRGTSNSDTSVSSTSNSSNSRNYEMDNSSLLEGTEKGEQRVNINKEEMKNKGKKKEKMVNKKLEEGKKKVPHDHKKHSKKHSRMDKREKYNCNSDGEIVHDEGDELQNEVQNGEMTPCEMGPNPVRPSQGSPLEKNRKSSEKNRGREKSIKGENSQHTDFIILIYWPESLNTFLKVLYKRKNHNIIILSDQIPSYIYNNKLSKYNVCYIQKSPLILFNLVVAGILQCTKCIIFKNYLKLKSHQNVISYNEKAESINYFEYMCEYNDSDLILIFNNIQNIFRRRDINSAFVEYYLRESTETNLYNDYIKKKLGIQRDSSFHESIESLRNKKQEKEKKKEMEEVNVDVEEVEKKKKKKKRNIYLLMELNNTLSVQYLNNDVYVNVDTFKKKKSNEISISKAHNLLFLENYKKQIQFFKYGNLLVENIYKKIEHIFVDNYYFYLYFLQFTSASLFIDELLYHLIGYTFPIKNNSLNISAIEAFIDGTYTDSQKKMKTNLLQKAVNPKFHSKHFFLLFQNYLKKGAIIIGIYRCNKENNMSIVIPCPQRNFIVHKRDKVHVEKKISKKSKKN